MAISLTRQRRNIFEGILQLYRVGVKGANATTLSVDEFQSYINSTLTEYQKAHAAWARLVELEGADAATAFVAEDISPSLTAAEMSTTLATISGATTAILDAYEANFGSGIINRTFDYTNTSGVLSGGFAPSNVSAGVVTALNGLCATLRDACLPLVITE